MNMQILPTVCHRAGRGRGRVADVSSAKPMPEVTFNLLDGRNCTAADLRGKSVLINFWSVSCEICLRDMPRLTRLQET